MQALNKIEYEELQIKVKQINDLTNKVEKCFEKMNNLINENVNSGKGIWDGPDANEYKMEWQKLEENIPNIVNIYKMQAEKIDEFIKMSITQ